MGNRTFERHAARSLYDEFSRRWRRERRLAGKDGQPGYRKPTFHQWHEMHLRDQQMMRESTPVDVQEYLGRDPWEEQSPTQDQSSIEASRGVVTVPMGRKID